MVLAVAVGVLALPVLTRAVLARRVKDMQGATVQLTINPAVAVVAVAVLVQ